MGGFLLLGIAPNSLRDHLTAPLFVLSLHRLPLQNEKGSICSLVTQVDVLRYFVAHIHQILGSDLRASNALPSIAALGLVHEEHPDSSESNSPYASQTLRQMEKISADTSVVEVIDHLHKVSAVAIVDAEGKLIGDLSADSLRQLSVHNFKRLYQPACQMGDTVAVPPNE